MVVQESFSPKAMTASGAVLGASGGTLGGFLATVTGTIKLTYTDGAGQTILDTCPVTAGVFLPIPAVFSAGQAVYATLGGGAQGTFFIL